MKAAVVLVAAVVALPLAGCKKPKFYDTNVEITRITVPRRDAATGQPLTKDVAISYVQCPGDQIEVARGNREFAACMEKYKVGDRVPVHIEHYWSREGHWSWRVHRVGDCARPPDENDEASFESVEECEDLTVHGAVVGFHCDRLPKKALVAKCPWFRRE